MDLKHFYLNIGIGNAWAVQSTVAELSFNYIDHFRRYFSNGAADWFYTISQLFTHLLRLLII